jgi:hypothetical protein
VDQQNRDNAPPTVIVDKQRHPRGDGILQTHPSTRFSATANRNQFSRPHPPTSGTPPAQANAQNRFAMIINKVSGHAACPNTIPSAVMRV